MNGIPQGFDQTFLEWFRQKTEESWAKLARSEYQREGARWAHPLNDQQINDIEQKWSLRFPADYRLFLKVLHTVENTDKPLFWNWLTQEALIRDALAWPLQGLLFDLEKAGLWLAAWGPKPDSFMDRKKHLQEAMVKAPLLVPILGHRYLLGEPNRIGNPVLSIYQSDIIVYGDTLRDYFLNEFSWELGLERGKGNASFNLPALPFWGAMSDWRYDA